MLSCRTRKSTVSRAFVLLVLAAPARGAVQVVRSMAALDPRVSLSVSESVAIESRFEGLPVVEPHVSAHPGDPDHLLVAAMVVTDITRPYESCRLSSFVSVRNS